MIKKGMKEYATRANPGEVWIRWLGVAGFEIRTSRTVILIDPFLSRPGRLDVTANQPLEPDFLLIDSRIKEADFILVGHSHYDHVMDVPEAALRTGAEVIGSASALNIARASGVPEEKLREISGGEEMSLGEFQVTVIRSEHGKVYQGKIPLPGNVEEPPVLPIPASGYRVGAVFGFLVRAGNLSIYHQGSAGLKEENLRGVTSDVLLIGIAGRESTPNYTRIMIETLKPQIVIPCHYDDFFSPLEDGLKPNADVEGFSREVGEAQAGLEPLFLDLFQAIRLPLDGGLLPPAGDIEVFGP